MCSATYGITRVNTFSCIDLSVSAIFPIIFRLNLPFQQHLGLIIIMIMSNSVNFQRSWTVYNNKIRLNKIRANKKKSTSNSTGILRSTRCFAIAMRRPYYINLYSAKHELCRPISLIVQLKQLHDSIICTEKQDHSVLSCKPTVVGLR